MYESVYPALPPTPTTSKLCTAGSHLLTSGVLLSYLPRWNQTEYLKYLHEQGADGTIYCYWLPFGFDFETLAAVSAGITSKWLHSDRSGS